MDSAWCTYTLARLNIDTFIIFHRFVFTEKFQAYWSIDYKPCPRLGFLRILSSLTLSSGCSTFCLKTRAGF